MDKKQFTFISYSRVDQAFALKLARELKSSGFNVWLDQLDIPKGARWDDEVERALRNCDSFLIILTPASSSSQNVKDEIGYAVDSGKRVLPILLEKCDIPMRLHRIQYIDFTKMNERDGFEGVKELLRGPDTVPPPSPPPIPPPNRIEILLRNLKSTRGIYSIVALVVIATVGTLAWPRMRADSSTTPEATSSPTLSPTAVAIETEPVLTAEPTLPTDTATLEPSATPLFTPPVTPFVRIGDITLDAHRNYVVDYETYGYTETLPGMHVHFFFNIFAPETVGAKGTGDSIGGGKWILYGGPRPFKGYSVEVKMSQSNTATQMCALVANPDHSIILESGNCLDLPESP
jgi:hypothetical protein